MVKVLDSGRVNDPVRLIRDTINTTVAMFKLFGRNLRSSQFAKLRPQLRSYSARPTRTLASRFKVGVVAGIGGSIAYALLADKPTELETLGAPTTDLQPPTKSDPFPSTLNVGSTAFTCVGTGVRSVTFLQFHVYAVGMYLCNDDLDKARNILEKHKQNFKLQDDNLGEVLNSDAGTETVDELLRENVRFAVRIVPVRNTDFNHMRDGIVSNIMNRPEARQITDSAFGEGITHLKEKFGRKGKFPKGNIMIWCRDLNGGMDSYYGSSDSKLDHLCSVESPDVSRCFFLQYLTGEKPNSPTLKERTLDCLATLVK